jgi:hypothetical protein
VDSGRFDSLTRSLAAAKTRRGLLGGLAALVAGARATSAQDGCPLPGQTRNTKGQCNCPAGTDPCPTGCFNKKTDPGNCGRCGTACPPGAACVKGECRCPAGGCTTTTTTTAAPTCAAEREPCLVNGDCCLGCCQDGLAPYTCDVNFC